MANVPAATQALDVLELLARHAAPLPAAAIARDLDLPRSTTYHLLSALRDRGFVVHLPDDRRWGLGVAAFALGSAYVRQEPLRWIAQTVLADLVAETTHNGHFAVLHGADVLYVIEERAAGRPSLVTEAGVRLPAHLTASGLAMLAALPAPQVRALVGARGPLVRRHERGPRTPTELRRELAAVRRAGHAAEDGFVTPGFASVATPVLDHAGHPAAAVALTFPSAEVGAADREALAGATARAAAEVARRIHGRPPATPPPSTR
jgi:DNA-binding IclR family transcriptional regulator